MPCLFPFAAPHGPGPSAVPYDPAAPVPREEYGPGPAPHREGARPENKVEPRNKVGPGNRVI